MAKIELREKAQKLRKNGLGISVIAKDLNISKSTVSYWCKNIKLTEAQIKSLQEKSLSAGVKKFIELGENKRLARLKREVSDRTIGKKEVGHMSKQNLFFLGLGLYWGEGYKYSNSEFGFTNSDINMILVFLRWLKVVYGVDRNDLILRVSINHTHSNRLEEVLTYWSKKTDIPLSQFTKTSLIKTSSIKKYTNHERYYGILRIKVRRGSSLKQRVLGSIDACSQI